MPCDVIKSPEGLTVIACHRGPRRVCAEPDCTYTATKLCDFPLTGAKAGKTCDRRLCERHAHETGPDRHFCPLHFELHDVRLRIEEINKELIGRRE